MLNDGYLPLNAISNLLRSFLMWLIFTLRVFGLYKAFSALVLRFMILTLVVAPLELCHSSLLNLLMNGPFPNVIAVFVPFYLKIHRYLHEACVAKISMKCTIISYSSTIIQCVYVCIYYISLSIDYTRCTPTVKVKQQYDVYKVYIFLVLGRETLLWQINFCFLLSFSTYFLLTTSHPITNSYATNLHNQQKTDKHNTKPSSTILSHL